MYRPHTFAVGRPTSSTASSQCSTRLLAPVAQRQRVVLAQVFLVQHLEPDVLDLGDDPSGAGQLPVREHVAVDEPAGGRALPVVVPGDAVVEQQSAGAQLRLAGSGSTPGSSRTPMCSVRPIEDTASNCGLANVAVVEVPNLGQLGQPLVGDRLLRPLGLLGRQRDADRLHALAAPRSAPCRPNRIRRRAAGRRAEGAASRTPAGTCCPAPPPGWRRHRGSRRRCRSSTGRAPTRRTGWTRRSGGGSLRRRESCCAASPQRPAASLGSASCGGGAIGSRCPRPIERTIAAITPRRGPPELQLVGQRRQQLERVAGVHAVRLEVAGDVGAREPEVAWRGGEVVWCRAGSAGPGRIRRHRGRRNCRHTR